MIASEVQRNPDIPIPAETNKWEDELKILLRTPIVKETSAKIFNYNNTYKHYPRNNFMIQTMLALGGGEKRTLFKMLKYRRLGGSFQDKLNYIELFRDDATKPIMIGRSKEEYKKLLCGTTATGFLPFDDVIKKININWDASSGFIWKSFGLNKKRDCAVLCLNQFRRILYNWGQGLEDIFPMEIISIATRPKLISVDKAVIKMRKDKPCCRIVSICSPLEQFLGFPFYYGIYEQMKNRFQESNSGSCIGIKRMSKEWNVIGEKMKRANHVFTGDWSTWDTSVRADLIEFTMEMFLTNTAMDKYSGNYKKTYLKWFKKNLIRKSFSIDGKGYKVVNNGVPSGSLWTSVLNTGCNYILIDSILLELGYKNYEIFVYGDDHMILFYENVKKDFIDKYRLIASERYNMKSNKEELILSSGDRKFVGYKVPIYEPGSYLSKGTSHLKPIGFKYYKRKRDIPAADFSKGLTHRWSYNFAGRPKFLQYSWDEYGNAIRPSFETVNRIINPENAVKTLRQHKVLLYSHLVDNIFNEHIVNKMFHYEYDRQWMEKLPYMTNKIPRQYDLWKMSEYSDQVLFRKSKSNERVWYRKVDHYVDLGRHPFTKSYVAEFVNNFFEAIKVYRHAASEEFYKFKDRYREYMNNNSHKIKDIIWQEILRRSGSYNFKVIREQHVIPMLENDNSPIRRFLSYVANKGVTYDDYITSTLNNNEQVFFCMIRSGSVIEV